MAGLDAFLEDARRRIDGAPTATDRLAEVRHVLSTVFMGALWKLPPIVAAGILGHHLLRRWAPAGLEDDVAAVARGLRGNVTTEMDLRVGDVADVARGHDELIAALTAPRSSAEERLERVRDTPGGPAFLDALDAFLRSYGMRGPAEIDLARPRWRDDPASLLGMIASHLLHDAPEDAARTRAHRDHHDALVAAGDAAAQRLARAARHGPWGWLRGAVVRRLTRVARALPALREHPKFLIVRTLDLIRPVVLEAGADLVRHGRVQRAEDVFWMTLPELIDAATHNGSAALVAATDVGDLRPLIERRKREAEHDARLKPPRLMTSDGLIPTLAHHAGRAPDGALLGSPVSPGVVEGRARVVLDPVHAGLEPGEILIAPYTDPGWTPLFTQAGGLVMEVGGLMTHGSVVAREYGLPAVVGVEGATTRIATGQRVRVSGDEGYVELLEEAPPGA
jgi:pyruvate,water dikinase